MKFYPQVLKITGPPLPIVSIKSNSSSKIPLRTTLNKACKCLIKFHTKTWLHNTPPPAIRQTNFNIGHRKKHAIQFPHPIYTLQKASQSLMKQIGFLGVQSEKSSTRTIAPQEKYQTSITHSTHYVKSLFQSQFKNLLIFNNI